MGALNGELKRTCPICAAPISLGLLMCRNDWAKVPADLQREVNESWRAVKNRQASSLEESKERATRYRLAAKAALDAVREKVA